MPSQMPKPKFIEVGPRKVEAVPPPTELGWQRVEEFLQVRELSQNSKKAYERQLRQFYEWVQKPWQSVTHRDVDKYKLHLKELPSKRGGFLSPASINQSLNALRSFFKWLTVKDYISRNPTLTVEPLKISARLPQDLNEKEVDSLTDALAFRGESEVRDRAILHALAHGLRASEVSKLDVRDYDGKAFSIEGAKWSSDGRVPLKPDAISALDSYLGWCVRQGIPTTPESPLFISLSNNSKGKRLGYRGIYNLVKDLAEASGLENIHPHQLRHTCATLLVLGGMDTMLAKRYVRIKSDNVFARYGDRALDIKMEEAFDELHGVSSRDIREGQTDSLSVTSDLALSKTIVTGNSKQHQLTHPTVYQLKIALRGIRPAIWRRVQVRGDSTLEYLHWVIQFAMGWTGSHLHSFAIQGMKPSVSRPGLGLDELDTYDEPLIELSKVATEEKFKLFYLYDFGDSWAHEVLVEKILTAKSDTHYPICINAKRACPPEDCGGTWGYQALLKAIKNPNHPEHALRLEWLGTSFNPEKVDLNEINHLLKSIPHDTSEFNGYTF